MPVSGSKLRFFGLIALLFLIVFAVRHYGLSDGLSPELVQERVNSFGMAAPVVFAGIYALATILFLPGTIFTLAGGALFGPLLGTLYVVIGATVGAVIAFVIARYLGGSFIEDLMKRKFQTLHAYNHTLEKKGLATVLFLRFVPLFPFNGLNFALGVTKVRLKDYFIGTLFGIIPGSFVYAYFGDSLASLAVGKIILAVLLILVLSLVIFLYRKLGRKNAQNEYDVIAIGGGAGGLVMVVVMNLMGFKTLLIDRADEHLGGDCLNFGCVPSKALIHIARMIKQAHESIRFGVKATGEVDMKVVKTYIRDKQAVFREHENADYFRSKGIDVELGEVKFTGKNTLSINGKTYSGRKIVIATGSRPRELRVPGIEKTTVWTNETIFDNEVLPKKMVVIGAGPIGMEIAQAYRYLGAEVTMVQRGLEVLQKEDKEVAWVLHQSLERDGINFVLGYEPTEVLSKNTIRVAREDGDALDLEFDLLLVSIGRIINKEGLDLEKAGIELTEDGRSIQVDAFLRTTNKNVWLCGDIVGQHQFTHAASFHAGLLINNLLSPKKKRLNTDHMAWVTYTHPEIGTFGLSEAQLKERGIKYTVVENHFKEDDRAIVDDYPESMMKLFIGNAGKLLGGTMVAPHAGELIQELILANTAGLSVEKIFGKIYPYPTATAINKRAIGDWRKGKLTVRNKKILRTLFKLIN